MFIHDHNILRQLFTSKTPGLFNMSCRGAGCVPALHQPLWFTPLTLCLLASLLAILLGGCGARDSVSLGQSANAFPKATSQDAQEGVTQKGEAWVLEGEIRLSVSALDETMTALRVFIKQSGKITYQSINGHSNYRQATLDIRVSPQALNGLVEWLNQRGQVTHQELRHIEVSRQLLSHEIKVKNAQKALDRLSIFMKRDSLEVSDVLKVEQEMTRLRTIIEETTRVRTLLKSRVDQSTLKVILYERANPTINNPRAHFYIAGRPTLFLDAQTLDLGWGLSIYNPNKPATFHLDFDHIPDASFTMIKFGSGVYSEFFGNGKRRFLNPHIGFEMGYAYQDQSQFVFGGSVGVELLRSDYFLIDARGEALALLGDDGMSTRILGGLNVAVVY
jgi:hypothetical protein